MKKYTAIILVSLFSISVITSCKKDSKDYSASVKDKTWWGTMTYTGQNTEYYSVYFNKDNSLLWCQLSGDYPGKWQVTDNQLTMIFDGSGVEVKANVSDDDNLSHFVVKNTSSYEINSCTVIKNPNPSLDNTVWEGLLQNLGTMPQQRYVMTFKPGSQIDLAIGSGYAAGTYQLLQTGGGIKASFGTIKFIGIVTANNEMRGSYLKSQYSWQATKK